MDAGVLIRLMGERLLVDLADIEDHFGVKHAGQDRLMYQDCHLPASEVEQCAAWRGERIVEGGYVDYLTGWHWCHGLIKKIVVTQDGNEVQWQVLSISFSFFMTICFCSGSERGAPVGRLSAVRHHCWAPF